MIMAIMEAMVLVAIGYPGCIICPGPGGDMAFIYHEAVIDMAVDLYGDTAVPKDDGCCAGLHSPSH